MQQRRSRRWRERHAENDLSHAETRRRGGFAPVEGAAVPHGCSHWPPSRLRRHSPRKRGEVMTRMSRDGVITLALVMLALACAALSFFVGPSNLGVGHLIDGLLHG